MMQWFTTDSSSRESRTFVIISLSWLAIWVKYLLAGLRLPFELGVVPAMTATEFGAATAAVMAVWLGREWIKK